MILEIVIERSPEETLRQTFTSRADAHQAFAEALTRYTDCEVRLLQDGVALASAAPVPS